MNKVIVIKKKKNYYYYYYYCYISLVKSSLLMLTNLANHENLNVFVYILKWIQTRTAYVKDNKNCWRASTDPENVWQVFIGYSFYYHLMQIYNSSFFFLMNSVKRYSRTFGEQPPKMQRLGGRLWAVVAYESWTARAKFFR